ncbi:hypothetical protein Tco_0290608 [Tanacetum coccineum]
MASGVWRTGHASTHGQRAIREVYFLFLGLSQQEQLRATAFCMEGEANLGINEEGNLYEQFLAISQEESARAYVALAAFRVMNPEGLNHAMEFSVSIEDNQLYEGVMQSKVVVAIVKQTTSKGDNIRRMTYGEKAPGPDGFNFKFIKRFWSIFRPISLIGCYYKIVAKILVEKVKKVVDKMVGDVQSGFIEGRSASTSILVNGSPTDEFCLERDIWQGDPLSPFLFIIAAEGLNVMVREATSKCIFRGISVWDDNVVVSGLKVNLNKSRVYGVGVPQNEIEGMARWMGCYVGEFPFTYLGLPIGSNIRKVSAWRPIVEKVKKRLSEWRAKSMSFGGRLTLVKSVIGSLPLVIRSIYGSDGGLGSVSTMKEACGCGVWGDIVRVGLDLDKLGIGFTNSFCKRVGNGWNTYFWEHRWRGDMSFKDRFSRLYHLDSRKEASMAEK